MQRAVVVLDADEKNCRDLCSLIEKSDCRAYAQHSLPEMEAQLRNNECLVVMIDIDSVPIDNRTIREMTLKYPGAYFLCMSAERFHPDLKEALCYHLYACISKPIDPDEVHFWLRSIFTDEGH
jgi:DNA-binding NtrC family response regulator